MKDKHNFWSDEESANPWQINKSTEVYSNSWISLTEHKVLNPAGNEGIYGEVHFKNYAIAVIPLTADYYTYLVGQYRFPLKEYSWEVPMGGGPINEPVLESAKRELQEETGIEALEWKEIAKIHTSNSVTDETGFIFVAQNLSYGASSPEDTEVLKTKKVSLNDAVEMVMENKITDAISVAGILKTKRLIDKGLI